MALGAVIGAFTGLVTVAYRQAVHHGNSLLLEGITHSEGDESMLLSALCRLLLPAVGALVVGVILYRLHRPSALTGAPAVIRSVQTGQLDLPVSMAAPSAASVAILATGGSAGPEGPIVEISSVMGARAGAVFGLPARLLRTLVASGVAAGVSSVFGAPLAGVFFAIEVIMQEYRLATFAPVLMASVVSSIVTQGFLGDIPPAIQAPQLTTSFSEVASEIPLFCLLGAAMGGLSIAFIKSIDLAGNLFGRLRLPAWGKPALGGLGVGLLGVGLPVVMGEGYGFINQALAGEAVQLPFFTVSSKGYGLVALFLAIAAVKMIATSFTLGSGAPGGSFAPGVFVGATAGLCLGGLFDMAWPGGVVSRESYGLMGIAGMVAGMFNAPMTGIMLVLRQAENYQMQVLIPLMSTVAISVFVMHRWRNVSIYTWTLDKLGLPWEEEETRDPLLGMAVGDVFSRDFLALDETRTVTEALDRLRVTDQSVIVVRSTEGTCRGLVALSDLRLAFQDRQLSHLLTLSDLVTPPEAKVLVATNLRDAVRRFSKSSKEGFAVYRNDTDAWPIGVITRATVLDVYRSVR